MNAFSGTGAESRAELLPRRAETTGISLIITFINGNYQVLYPLSITFTDFSGHPLRNFRSNTYAVIIGSSPEEDRLGSNFITALLKISAVYHSFIKTSDKRIISLNHA
jgi:hypothetical protein